MLSCNVKPTLPMHSFSPAASTSRRCNQLPLARCRLHCTLQNRRQLYYLRLFLNFLAAKWTVHAKRSTVEGSLRIYKIFGYRAIFHTYHRRHVDPTRFGDSICSAFFHRAICIATVKRYLFSKSRRISRRSYEIVLAL